MASSDFFQSVGSEITLYAVPLALFLLTLGIILFLARSKIRRFWLNRRTRRRLDRLGLQQFSDFQCPDGLGNYFNVDRLLLRRDGVSLVLFKQFPGSIFCAEHIDEWTQMLGGKSYRFKNPLVDLDYKVKAVSACIPDVPVDGYLVFDHTAVFPKGHPDRVIDIDHIPHSLKRDKNEKAQAAVVEAWEQLRAIQRSS